MDLNNNGNGNGHLTSDQIVELKKQLLQSRSGRRESFQRLTRAALEAESLSVNKNDFKEDDFIKINSKQKSTLLSKNDYIKSRRNSKKYLNQLKITCLRSIKELNGVDENSCLDISEQN